MNHIPKEIGHEKHRDWASSQVGSRGGPGQGPSEGGGGPMPASLTCAPPTSASWQPPAMWSPRSSSTGSAGTSTSRSSTSERGRAGGPAGKVGGTGRRPPAPFGLGQHLGATSLPHPGQAPSRAPSSAAEVREGLTLHRGRPPLTCGPSFVIRELVPAASLHPVSLQGRGIDPFADRGAEAQLGPTARVPAPLGAQRESPHPGPAPPSLFPTMPRHNFHKVAPLVKSLCAKHGIKYQEKPLLRALQDIIR